MLPGHWENWAMNVPMLPLVDALEEEDLGDESQKALVLNSGLFAFRK